MHQCVKLPRHRVACSFHLPPYVGFVAKIKLVLEKFCSLYIVATVIKKLNQPVLNVKLQCTARTGKKKKLLPKVEGLTFGQVGTGYASSKNSVNTDTGGGKCPDGAVLATNFIATCIFTTILLKALLNIGPHLWSVKWGFIKFFWIRCMSVRPVVVLMLDY